MKAIKRQEIEDLKKSDNGEDEVVQQAEPQQVGGGRYNNQGTN